MSVNVDKLLALLVVIDPLFVIFYTVGENSHLPYLFDKISVIPVILENSSSLFFDVPKLPSKFCIPINCNNSWVSIHTFCSNY